MALPEAAVATEAMFLNDASDIVIAFQYRTNAISGTSYAKRGSLTIGTLTFTIQLTPGATNPEISVTVSATGLTSTTVVADTYNVWRDVRFECRRHSGDISVPTPPTVVTYLYVDGTPEGPIATPGAVWHAGADPWQTCQVAWATTNAALDDEYGAHSDDTWYEHAAIGEQIEFRHIFMSVNGVVRYYDQCTDGYAEWTRINAPAFHSPRYGEALPMTETAAGVKLAPTAMSYYNASSGHPLDYGGYHPATAATFRAYSSGWKRDHRMLHCVSGAEMRGNLMPDRAEANVANVMPLFWPRYNQQRRASSIAGPYLFEVPTVLLDPRDGPNWTEPTLNSLGTYHRTRYAADHPEELLSQRLESDGAGPTTGDPDNTANFYRPSERGNAYAYNAYDGDHVEAAWHTASGEVAGGYPHLCGQDPSGVPVIAAYELSGATAYDRYNPVMRRDSDNDLADLRDDVIAAEDATVVTDPVSGELAFVALQDTWASNATGDYDVNLCIQRIGYAGGYVLETPKVLATLGAADVDEAWLLADATIDARGRVWAVVWRVASASVGNPYSTMQALVYRAENTQSAATLIATVTVDRPPHNAAWLVWDTVSDEAFLAHQDPTDAQGIVIHALPQLTGEVVATYTATAGDGTLPTPPYGAWWGTTQAMQYRLLAVWVDEAGRWRARWAYAEWFNAYSTVDVVIQALAEDDSENDYHNWPIVYPDLTDDGRRVGPEPEYVEDIEETEADLHPLTGAATWSDRDLDELLQGAPA